MAIIDLIFVRQDQLKERVPPSLNKYSYS